jgi:hypothetical protein
VEKFELLLKILRQLQDAHILKHIVLVGSWCQNFYRHMYGNPAEIPAARTLDADLLIPKRLPISAQGNITQIMKDNDFAIEINSFTGYYRFTHPDLKIEFLTDPGAKSDETVHNFKQLGVTAQELRYMSIPLSYLHTAQAHRLLSAEKTGKSLQGYRDRARHAPVLRGKAPARQTYTRDLQQFSQRLEKTRGRRTEKSRNGFTVIGKQIVTGYDIIPPKASKRRKCFADE